VFYCLFVPVSCRRKGNIVRFLSPSLVPPSPLSLTLFRSVRELRKHVVYVLCDSGPEGVCGQGEGEGARGGCSELRLQLYLALECKSSVTATTHLVAVWERMLFVGRGIV